MIIIWILHKKKLRLVRLAKDLEDFFFSVQITYVLASINILSSLLHSLAAWFKLVRVWTYSFGWMVGRRVAESDGKTSDGFYTRKAPAAKTALKRQKINKVKLSKRIHQYIWHIWKQSFLKQRFLENSYKLINKNIGCFIHLDSFSQMSSEWFVLAIEKSRMA